MDGQTIVSIAIGAVITLMTFWLAYKKTIGAQDERVRAASQELIASVLKRVAVEREYMMPALFSEIRRAKAYRAGIAVDRLITFSEARGVVLAEVIDNNFLDQASKNAIIALLEQSSEPISAGADTSAAAKSSGRQDFWLSIIGVLAALTGLGSSLLAASLSFDSGLLKATEKIAEIFPSGASGFFITGLGIVLLSAAATWLASIIFERQGGRSKSFLSKKGGD
jgi:hypothetical protein